MAHRRHRCDLSHGMSFLTWTESMLLLKRHQTGDEFNDPLQIHMSLGRTWATGEARQVSVLTSTLLYLPTRRLPRLYRYLQECTAPDTGRSGDPIRRRSHASAHRQPRSRGVHKRVQRTSQGKKNSQRPQIECLALMLWFFLSGYCLRCYWSRVGGTRLVSH